MVRTCPAIAAFERRRTARIRTAATVERRSWAVCWLQRFVRKLSAAVVVRPHRQNAYHGNPGRSQPEVHLEWPQSIGHRECENADAAACLRGDSDQCQTPEANRGDSTLVARP